MGLRAKVTLALLAALVIPRHAFADESSVAEQLFLQGKQLIAKKEYEKACAAFKASHDLDPTATGTLLNLALCHEQIGRLATAWAEFRQVAAESDGRRADRVTMAREHEARLAPLLEHLVVDVAPAARRPGFSIRLDHEAVIPEAAWSTSIPVDSGEHVVEATAPGYVAKSYRVFVGTHDGDGHVIVSPLAPLPPPPVAYTPDRTQRNVAFATMGAGVVVAAIGIGFGVRAIGKKNDAHDLCMNNVCMNDADQRTASAEWASAHSSATTSNVLFVVSGALAAGGVVLALTAPRPLFGTRLGLTANGVEATF